MNDASIYRSRDLTSYLSQSFLSALAMQVQSVAIGWQIYDIERTPLALGWVGLCQFAPMFLLTLPAGEMVDRFDARKILAMAQFVEALCAAAFLLCSWFLPHNVAPYYIILTFFGAAIGFSNPARQSLLPFLVPTERLAKAMAQGSTAFTVALIAGPALGGLLYALGLTATYGFCLVAFLLTAFLTSSLGGRRVDHSASHGVSRIERVKEGVHFVRTRPIVLGAISLDLMAVLLGGAVALLPVFARDVLHTGPTGLGLLRSAPAAGAALMAFTLSHRPLENRSGTHLFTAVAIFGVATVVFGLSTNFYLSLVALFVTGASDMVSVFIRSSLINFATPDNMRGRVGAVYMLFVSASNELGEFESGMTAAWFGTVPAVVIGGLGTLAVVVAWMWLFPPLRKVDRLIDAGSVQ